MVGKKKKKKEKINKIRSGVRWWWWKKEKKNNLMIKTKSKNQNYVPNTIFFIKLWFQLWNQNYVPNRIFLTILNSNQDWSSNFNKVKSHETKTKNENTYQTGPKSSKQRIWIWALKPKSINPNPPHPNRPLEKTMWTLLYHVKIRLWSLSTPDQNPLEFLGYSTI